MAYDGGHTMTGNQREDAESDGEAYGFGSYDSQSTAMQWQVKAW